MRLARDEWALRMAALCAQRSTCIRRRVGCVLLNSRGHVLSTGYNGVASTLPHCNEVTGQVVNPALKTENGRYRASEHWERSTIEVHENACEGAGAPSGAALDACQAIHAEQNALLQCHDIYQIRVAYITASPCITCCKLLLNTSCKRIVFMDEYPHPQARSLWEGAGRDWDQIFMKPAP